MSNELTADREGRGHAIRAMVPNWMRARHGLDDQKIIVTHIMTAAAAMIAVASQPISLKPSWM
jgi:hypothetical protein